MRSCASAKVSYSTTDAISGDNSNRCPLIFLLHCRDEIGYELVCLWGTQAGCGVPTLNCIIALYMSRGVCVISHGDILEILAVGIAVRQFVKRRIDETERMSCLLVGDRHDTRPERC